jgi:hypothetical protein
MTSLGTDSEELGDMIMLGITHRSSREPWWIGEGVAYTALNPTISDTATCRAEREDIYQKFRARAEADAR